MAWRLGKGSEVRLRGVHEDLALVVRRALEISELDFSVTEGMRTLERQRELVASGKSKTLNSRHLTGHAVDLAAIVDGKVSWEWKYYELLANAMKQAATELGVAIEWGGDWETFKDGPHFQLSRKEYQ